MNGEPGKLLRLYMNEDDWYEGTSLYEAIVARCRQLHLRGVTVFRGLEGFGQFSEVHPRRSSLKRDRPIIIHIVETPEKAKEALPVLQAMMPNGVVAVTDVEVLLIGNGRISSLT